MKIQSARNNYNKGLALRNTQSPYFQPIIFQLCGHHYTSNRKRAKTGRQYKIDNKYWEHYQLSTSEKLLAILKGTVVRVKTV